MQDFSPPEELPLIIQEMLIEWFSLNGDFSFYDNCVDEISINGQTQQTGKISYLVDFSCSLIAKDDVQKNKYSYR